MATTTNPTNVNPTADAETATPVTYTSRIRGLVGDRDPLAIMAATPDALDGLTLGVPIEIMRARPFKDKWTPNEILGHLVDCELVYGYRMRMTLCEESPHLQGFDQDRWVAIQAHNDVSPADHMMRFRSLRTMNMLFWRALPAEGLRKFGIHSERGPENLEFLRTLIAGHDLAHLDQLSNHLEAARAVIKA